MRFGGGFGVSVRRHWLGDSSARCWYWRRVLVAVPGGVTYVILRSTLYSRLDQQLVTAGQGSVVHLIGDAAHNAPNPQTIWVVQLDSAGAVRDHLPAAGIGNIRHLNVSAAQRKVLAEPDPTPRDVRTVERAHLRVISEQQPFLVGTIVLGLSTAGVTDTLRELLLVEVALAAGAVVVTAAAAFE